MGFHKRRLTNKLIRYYYCTNGINSLQNILTADAFIYEDGLSSWFVNAVNSDKVCWFKIAKTIYTNIYSKGISMLTSYEWSYINTILENSAYSRDQKLIDIKQYLSQFKDKLDAYGIDYTYLASQILKEHHEKLNGSPDTRRRI